MLRTCERIDVLVNNAGTVFARRTLTVDGIESTFAINHLGGAQADFLARSQLYEGDYREAEKFVGELKNVTPEAVQRVARRYMKGFRFAYVGDPSKLDPRTIALF